MNGPTTHDPRGARAPKRPRDPVMASAPAGIKILDQSKPTTAQPRPGATAKLVSFEEVSLGARRFGPWRGSARLGFADSPVARVLPGHLIHAKAPPPRCAVGMASSYEGSCAVLIDTAKPGLT